MNRRIWSTEEKTAIVLEMIRGANGDFAVRRNASRRAITLLFGLGRLNDDRGM